MGATQAAAPRSSKPSAAAGAPACMPECRGCEVCTVAGSAGARPDATAADHSARRACPASKSSSRSALMSPSIMSANTAGHGRSRRRTETTAPPSGRRRMVRSTPTTRGGLRNAGTPRPSARAADPSPRTAAAKRSEVASGESARTFRSIFGSIHEPYDSRSEGTNAGSLRVACGTASGRLTATTPPGSVGPGLATARRSHGRFCGSPTNCGCLAASA